MHFPRVHIRRHLTIHLARGRTQPRFQSLHALISHELRAPSVTCERVPDLSGVILVPLLAILLGLGATSVLYYGTELSP